MDTISPWDGFMQKLADALRHLAPHKYFAIHVEGSPRYVEFSCNAEGVVRVESVSNAWLPEDQRLTESQGRKLVEMGWVAPNLRPPLVGKHVPGSPNYYIDMKPPVAFDRVASLATSTLVLIHGAQKPEDLEIRFGNAANMLELIGR